MTNYLVVAIDRIDKWLFWNRKEPKLSILARLYWAWQMRALPWNVPDGVKWIAIDQRLTKAEIKHAQELAAKHGWEKEV